MAVAADDSGYADSPNGIVYTMTVPMRLDTPSVKWAYNWNAAANNPIPAAGFRSGGLQVTVTPENAASVPPGGSTYLLRAKITGTDGTTVTYPVSAMSESGGSYVCSLTDTLKLPNIFSVVTHENQTLQLTNGIQISRVTVIADSKSDRYTESDPAERRF